MPTFNEQLSAWRTANQTGQGGLMEKLTIDGTLYDVKDPGLDYLAEQTESRIHALETITDGSDLTQIAQQINDIIAELENSENGNAWKTAIDKLAGLGVKTPAVYYTQAECDEYNTANSLKEGDEGYRTTSDVKTPAVYNTVKDYVDAKVATINAAIADKADAATVTTALAAKANAADFTTGTASYVTSSYANGNLSISTSNVTVYVPTANNG